MDGFAMEMNDDATMIVWAIRVGGTVGRTSITVRDDLHRWQRSP